MKKTKRRTRSNENKMTTARITNGIHKQNKLDKRTVRGWLHRLDDMMRIAGCGFGTYTRQYE
jgi:hypothetical protein